MILHWPGNDGEHTPSQFSTLRKHFTFRRRSKISMPQPRFENMSQLPSCPGRKHSFLLLPSLLKLTHIREQYCSAECQKEHWTLHKIDCKHPQSKDSWKPDWHVEKRNPTFIGDDVPAVVSHGQKKFLWGNVPAVDILRIQQNEKGALPTNLNLLFAGK